MIVGRHPSGEITLGGTASDVANKVAMLAGDPALPTVVDLVKQLYALEASRPGGPPAPKPTGPVNYKAGIGLSAAVGPLKAILYVRKNPWVVPAAVAGILGLPLLLGFTLGRASKPR